MRNRKNEMNLEKYGYCSKTGKCINPFGLKPREIQEEAARIRHEKLITEEVEEALSGQGREVGRGDEYGGDDEVGIVHCRGAIMAQPRR